MPEFRFHQVDVFATGPWSGNPLAVVVGAEGLSDAQMQRFAHWTNLSETTFILPPTEVGADYRVRIFTPLRELPFAGHPTLGTAAVWLTEGGAAKGATVVQECGAGLVQVRRDGAHLGFAAPPLVRDGPVADDTLETVCAGLGIAPDAVEDAAWVDNGPGWMALLLERREAVLAVRPDFSRLNGLRVGLVGPGGTGDDTDLEVRAFTGAGYEDPVTGSLNAGIAQWLIETGRIGARYVARQGTVLGRRGDVHVSQEGDTIWVGGQVRTGIVGTAVF